MCLIESEVQTTTSRYFEDSKISYQIQDVSNSDVIKYLYVKSAYLCDKFQSIKDCNALANLCVLNLYSWSKSQCELIRNLINAPGRDKTVPKIYYLGDNGAKNAV